MKIGDEVRCVGTDSKSYVTVGSVYKITSVEGGYVSLIDDTGEVDYFMYPSNGITEWELVTEAEFKVGDMVVPVYGQSKYEIAAIRGNKIVVWDNTQFGLSVMTFNACDVKPYIDKRQVAIKKLMGIIDANYDSSFDRIADRILDAFECGEIDYERREAL